MVKENVKLFKCINCGQCCGPIFVTKEELRRIQEKVNRMPENEIIRLKEQKRDLLCIFRDIEKNRCSVYDVRPTICRMFGFYKGLVCPNNPAHATIGVEEGMKRLIKDGDKPVGVLGIDITWDFILKNKCF